MLYFEREFAYEYNESTNRVELVVYDEPITYKLEIKNNSIYINDELYEFDGFTLSPNTTFSVIEDSSNIYVNINIIIVSETNETFEFLMSYSFLKEAIPNA